jgi:hypothetical protein
LKPARKPKPAKVETPKRDQSTIAAWFRKMAEEADAGRIDGLAAVVMLQGGVIPVTNIADPVISKERMALAGSVAQLHHMLQASEHNVRMASIAQRD